VFRSAPTVIYTGLNKEIGNPREMEKNNDNPDYFDSDINISIPI
jgi:hypothetical protein